MNMNWKPFLKQLILLVSWGPLFASADENEIKVGLKAPDFSLQNQNKDIITLNNRMNQGWTVLYFYPKADTPGCTKQACAFRDNLQPLKELNTEIYGISTDNPENLKKFEQKYRLNFNLLSDSDATITKAYGVKMPLVNYAKRWTFIIDPNLIIRGIEDDVDPVMDARRVANSIKELQAVKD